MQELSTASCLIYYLLILPSLHLLFALCQILWHRELLSCSYSVRGGPAEHRLGYTGRSLGGLLEIGN